MRKLSLPRPGSPLSTTSIRYVVGVPLMVALPKNVALLVVCTMLVTSVHLILVLVDGSTSVHSPLTPLLSLFALKPKAMASDPAALSTWPPPVTWPGVVAGRTHALVAASHGSPASTAPLPFASAHAVIWS